MIVTNGATYTLSSPRKGRLSQLLASLRLHLPEIGADLSQIELDIEDHLASCQQYTRERSIWVRYPTGIKVRESSHDPKQRF